MSVEQFYKERIPILGPIINWMSGNGMDYGPFVAFLSFSLFVIGLFLLGVSGGQVLSVLFALMPLWLPVMLFFIFFSKWMDVIGTKFFLSQGRTLLRIKLPPEVTKSPEAMEFVISQVHATQNPDNYLQTYIDGKRPIEMTLELVSIGGEVRFYVNVPSKKVKDAFEAQLYAQYPGVEITEEAIDYAGEIPIDTKDHELFGIHMGKKKDQEFPIRTYIDYGMEKLPKEELKVDPMTPTLEFLGSISPQERVYIQIVCVPHRESNFDNGQLVAQPSWEKGVDKKIDEILNRDPKTKGPRELGEDVFTNDNVRLTPGERDKISAMERNAGKYAYETSIRVMYIAEKGHFNPSRISGAIRTFSQYDIIGRNQIGVRWRTDFDYKMISDPSGKRLDAMKRQELREYKMRKLFPKNAAGVPKIFTAEELATMFHLPGSVAITPTISRVQSVRSEAPANLPTG